MRQFLIVAVLAATVAAGYLVRNGTFPVSAKLASGKDGGKTATSQGRRSKTVPVRTASVRLETFRRQTEAVGTTRALQSVEIVPLSAGRIRSLSIESGKTVAAGAILAELDNDIQKADLAEASAKLDEAKRALVRAQELYRRNNIAEALVIELSAKRAVAVAEMNRAKRRLADRTVRAPFAGRTGHRKVDLGARVDTDTILATLDDISSIEIEAPISEVLYPSVHEGTRVTAQSAAFPGRTFTGTIASIDRRIDPVGRAFRVRIRVPNDDGALPTGMFMRVTILLDERQNPAIPEEALVVQAGKTFVYAVDDAQAARVPVKIGQRRDGLIEITGGLRPGAIVVTEGTHRLSGKAKVRIVSGEDASQPAGGPTAGLPASGAGKTGKKDGG
ncbi:MAG: efflux RND transporter periplasmic adaptor subunit [Hyphomicrobiaceae bacterium]